VSKRVVGCEKGKVNDMRYGESAEHALFYIVQHHLLRRKLAADRQLTLLNAHRMATIFLVDIYISTISVQVIYDNIQNLSITTIPSQSFSISPAFLHKSLSLVLGNDNTLNRPGTRTGQQQREDLPCLG